MKFDEKKPKSWSEITEYMLTVFPDMTPEKAKQKARDHIRTTKEYKERQQQDFEKSSIEYKNDGSIISEKFIIIRDGEDMTPEFLLEAHGLKPGLWEITSYKNNMWNTQIKGGSKQISYQSKLAAKPRGAGLSFTDIDEYLKTKKFKYGKPLTKPLNYDPCSDFLEITLPDLHSGLLAWRMETGRDYDLNIAKARFFQCMYDVRDRCQGQKLKKILFATLGDLLHFDNDNQTTTKGTFQQADGRFAKVYDATLDMMIDGITILGNIAPVEVIYIKGNHDGVTGYALMKAVEKAFTEDPNITFNTNPNPHKHQRNGNVLTGWTHGNMPATNMGSWLQDAAREDFGLSKFVEVHAGHFHTEKTREKKPVDYYQVRDFGGIVIRYLPTISNSSYWEHEMGYPQGTKTMVSYIWNEITGLRTMWYSNI